MSLSNPPIDRDAQLELVKKAIQRLEALEENILADDTDYWDDRVLRVLKDIQNIPEEDHKRPPRSCPRLERGAKVRIKGKGIFYGPHDFDVISGIVYNQLEPDLGEWNYTLWTREGYWKEHELEEVFISQDLKFGDHVRIISGDFRWFTGVIKEFSYDEEDGNGDLIWIIFDINPRMSGWENDPDPFTFSFHPYELEKI